MAKTPEELFQEAQALSEADRTRLLHLLAGQVTGYFESAEIEQAWLEECDRRLEQLANGQSEWVDGSRLLSHLRTSIGE